MFRMAQRITPYSTRKFSGIGCGKTRISLILGKLDDRAWPQTAVQMIVQENLGKCADEAFRNAHGQGREVRHSKKYELKR